MGHRGNHLRSWRAAAGVARRQVCARVPGFEKLSATDRLPQIDSSIMPSPLVVRCRAIVALAAIAITAPSLLSQTPSPASPFASVSGLAVDSLHGGYLRSAVVRVNGTSRAATTDSLGRFKI